VSAHPISGQLKPTKVFMERWLLGNYRAESFAWDGGICYQFSGDLGGPSVVLHFRKIEDPRIWAPPRCQPLDGSIDFQGQFVG
jgi:hypothetical protein